MRNKLIILLTLIFLLIPVYTLAVEVTGESLFPLAKDPRALGMAGAMTALGDSPTSAIFNPALMGEYNSFSLKVGFGFWPVDETEWNNFNKIMEYINIIGQQEPPDDDLSANTFLTGYANLGIGRLGLTVWGDANLNVEYYKFTNYNYNYNTTDPTHTVIKGNIWFFAPLNLNGALTLGLPIINLGNMKLNIGANLRVNVFGVEHQGIATQVNGAGLLYGGYIKGGDYYGYTAYNYLDRTKNMWNIRNWAIDLGAYLKLSDNFALGISAQNVYAKWIGGEYYWEEEMGYFSPTYDNYGNLTGVNYTYSSSVDSGSLSPEEIEVEFDIPPLTLKAGALLKLPVLSTRIAFDVDLDKNFQPTLYKLGIEQPLLFLTVRGGAILDTNFQPKCFTVGAGINLLFLRVDAGLGYQAEGSFMETIQNTMPLVASFSGSIQF
ncbi:MAG: hypothetical protein NZ841_04955 [Dictyoglomus sp.]|nr:hypothetical protein [Dictyoglomus sp.]MDW8188626.1 hypothetical protein [Dictyoglomus sp.]